MKRTASAFCSFDPMQTEVTVDINASPEQIWPILSDVRHWSKWTASITEIVLLDDKPIGVGSKARVRQPKLPTAVWTVTKWVPNSGFAWDNKSIGIYSVGEHWITTKGDGISTVRLGIRQTGWLASLVVPLLRELIERYVNTEAAGLKKECEATE
jgi:uncharacterized membrane protein